MNKKIAIFINILAIIQMVFLLSYGVHYLYIGARWGYGERIVLDMISDSIYLLFIISSIGLLLRKKWGWWTSAIIYINLLLAKVIANFAHLITTLDGIIIDPFNIKIFLFDISILVIYVIVLTFLFIFPTRKFFSVSINRNRSIFIAFVSALILYMFHFIVMLLSVT